MKRFCFITFHVPPPFRICSIVCFNGGGVTGHAIIPQIERKAILRAHGLNPNLDPFRKEPANDKHHQH